MANDIKLINEAMKRVAIPTRPLKDHRITPEDIEATGLTDNYREEGSDPNEIAWGAKANQSVSIIFDVAKQYILADPGTGGDRDMHFSVKGLTVPQIRQKLAKCIKVAIKDLGDYRDFFS